MKMVSPKLENINNTIIYMDYLNVRYRLENVHAFYIYFTKQNIYLLEFKIAYFAKTENYIFC